MTEEREHLQKLIELHRANLQHYEEQEAKYGLECPVYVKHGKEEARKLLTEARAKLAALEGRAPGAELSIPVIPQNLPPRGEFIGRDREMEQVRQALASRLQLTKSPAPSITPTLPSFRPRKKRLRRLSSCVARSACCWWTTMSASKTKRCEDSC
ncbi:MAG: hypothetical protein ACETWR_20715 [Anaerolineae bacterium]